MKYSLLKQSELQQAQSFLESLKDDFLVSRKARKKGSLRRYLVNKDRRMILAKDKNKIIGYITYKFNTRKKGWIIGIGVGKEYRGKGIGKALFRKAIKDLAKKHNKIIVRTWSTNKKSRSLFEKTGFKKYRAFKNQRIDGSDDVWHYKEINKK